MTAFWCPLCKRVSSHPRDFAESYCGNCHRFFDAAELGPVVVRIVGLVNGEPCPYDGTWLVEYDPTRTGVDPDGRPMTAHVVTTSDRGEAFRLSSYASAHAVWMQPSGWLRPDGMLDRPLTAFSIEVERAGDD